MRKFLMTGALLAAMAFGGTAQANVLDGAVDYEGHYYKVFEMEMTWANASEFCRSMGGHLATAETKAENEFMKDVFLNLSNSPRCWIGGRKNKETGIWRWVGGKVISSYYDWVGGKLRPSSSLGGNHICYWRDKKGQWDNLRGDNKYVFMCEWDDPALARESSM